MNARQIIAHRGFWTAASEKNSLTAFERALQQGFGIETDLRDLDGELVVSHDPARREAALAAIDFFRMCSAEGADGALFALNVKADGLHKMINEAVQISNLKPSQLFVFDMSVPDTLGYLNTSLPVFMRQSEYEPIPAFFDNAAGIWIDNFAGFFPQVNEAQKWLELGLQVAIVSPELHGRSHEDMWCEIRAAGLHRNEGFLLCTDFPSDALGCFGEI